MSSHETHAASRSISVLLVDDDAVFARLVEHQLKRFESRVFNYTWRQSAAEAITLLQTNSAFDIIITDYLMPVQSGLDFCLQLNELGIQIPIILLTGSRDFQLAVDAMKLGVADFLLKEDMIGNYLARTIINVVEEARVRKATEALNKRMMLSEKRSQAIKELVVTVCHEFNNPLAAVKISADLASRYAQTDATKQSFKLFEESFLRIQEVINELRDLNFEKVDAWSDETGRGQA